MPYSPSVGHVWRVTLAAMYPNSQLQLTGFHLVCTVAGFGGDPRAGILARVDQDWVNAFKATIATDVTYVGSRMSPVQTGYKWAPEATIPNSPGTSANPNLPTQVRPLVSWRTNFSSRSERGRSYLMTPTRDYSTQFGDPTAPYINLMNQWVQTVLAGYTDSGSSFVPCIYHRWKPPSVAIDPTPITGGLANTAFATQRRSGAFGRTNVMPW